MEGLEELGVEGNDIVDVRGVLGVVTVECVRCVEGVCGTPALKGVNKDVSLFLCRGREIGVIGKGIANSLMVRFPGVARGLVGDRVGEDGT